MHDASEPRREAQKVQPDPMQTAKLTALGDLRRVLTGEAEGVTFIDADGRKTDMGAASYVLLTRDRFTELAHGRLTELAPPSTDVVVKHMRVTLDDSYYPPDPERPLNRAERRAKGRRLRRGGR